ncbi:MAG: hypothetical protein KC474_03020 [Cyanobacteria bacterium HKST-UBA04]|nr:hypothetical protein [Cyanobacteria bacterium HKST-UBA04]
MWSRVLPMLTREAGVVGAQLAKTTSVAGAESVAASYVSGATGKMVEGTLGRVVPKSLMGLGGGAVTLYLTEKATNAATSTAEGVVTRTFRAGRDFVSNRISDTKAWVKGCFKRRRPADGEKHLDTCA